MSTNLTSPDIIGQLALPGGHELVDIKFAVNVDIASDHSSVRKTIEEIISSEKKYSAGIFQTIQTEFESNDMYLSVK